MAGTAATVSVLGLIVFGTLASLLGKIGERNPFRPALLETVACLNDARDLLTSCHCCAVYELSGDDFNGHEKLFR